MLWYNKPVSGTENEQEKKNISLQDSWKAKCGILQKWPLISNLSCILVLSKVYLWFFQSKDGVYLPSPWLWSGIVTGFSQNNAAERTVCKF